MDTGHISTLIDKTSGRPAEPKNRTQPVDTALRPVAAGNPEAGQTYLYQIVVKCQGSPVAEHVIAAATALAAINLVELSYSDPVTLEPVSVELGAGGQRQVTLARNWHGYSFDARAIET